MKSLISIIVVTSVMFSGLAPASGFSLLKRGKANTVNRWPYSFGDRYIYDNAGSYWNYDNFHKHKEYPFHRTSRYEKHRHLQFNYNHKRPENEKLDGLIKHYTRHNFHHKRSFHLKKSYHYDHIGR